MWTYIIRRLLILIPTLFGVTVVAFLVMQCAPGDPLASAGHGGAMNQNQDRTKYLLQRRDLDLDKPGLINLRYYAGRTESYRQGVEYVADIWSKPVKDLQNRLDKMLAEKEAQGELNEKDQKFFDFLASLGITDFTKVFEDKDKHEMLAQTIGGSSRSNLSNNKQGGYLRKWCEDAIHHGTPHAVAILADPKRSDAVRLGALRAVTKMVPEPAKPTYSKKRKEAETENILKVWELWYLHSLASGKLPPLDCKRYAKVKKRFDAILNAADDDDATTLSPGSADAIARDRVKWGMNFAYFNPKTQELFESGDAAVFYDVLTAKGSTLRQHDAATIALKTNVGMPLRFDLAAKDQEALTPAKDAKKDADPAALATARKNLNSITKNWQLHLATHPDLYQPSNWSIFCRTFTETQYARLSKDLITFNFGASTKDEKPVRQKIWDAFCVTAPLMIAAQLIIYFLAIPLGIVCAVRHNSWVDRLIQLKLFFLYSVPPFVAAMLMLMFVCYNLPVGGIDSITVGWFPMSGVTGPDYDSMSIFGKTIDRIWHAILPVTCLSLFALAGLAMYARTSMLEVISQDYIRTARAKGVEESKVVLKHAFRNSLIPLLTLFASFIPAMLGGSVLIEGIFNVPGMGKLGWDAIIAKDYPVLMALLYINAIIVMLSILLTDILYVVVDPRISFEAKK